MSHTITVTRALDDNNDNPEYSIGGTHGRDCSVWFPCHVEGCQADDEGEFHGLEHAHIGEGYGVQDPDDCGLRYAFEDDNPECQMTEVGEYDVKIDWDGDWWIATLIRRKED